jgi:competence ComEA-like helix-hairpin-helix protein
MAPKDEPDRRPDINSASVEELARLDAIDSETARAIIRLRDERGRIGGPEDLMQIPGISEQAAQQIGREVHFH